MPLGHRILLRLREPRPLADSTGARRRIAATVLRAARGRGLLAFSVAAERLQIVAACDVRDAGELARRCALSLQRLHRFGTPFVRGPLLVLPDAPALRLAVLAVLGRDGLDPADVLGDGCSLPDLLGLRVPGIETRANARALLGSFDREELLGRLGASGMDDAAMHLADLKDAAAAAFALPALSRRTAAEVLARRAAAHAVSGLASTGAIADALGVSRRHVQMLRGEPVPSRAVAAVRMQLQLRALRCPRTLTRDERVERQALAGWDWPPPMAALPSAMTPSSPMP